MRQARENLDEFGFTAVRGSFSGPELDEAEAIIDRLMASSHRRVQQRLKDMTGEARDTAVQPELLRPASLAKELRRCDLFKRCRELAQELLRKQPRYLFDHAIYKRPFNTAETPWHQDQAYLGDDIQLRSLHFWIPFQATSEANGTMLFAEIPRATYVAHAAASAAAPHILRTSAPPSATVRALELARGDVSVHTPLALHSTGPNHVNETRKAWIIHFGDKPNWYKRMLQARSRLRGNRWG